MALPTRKIGNDEVPAVGFGAMALAGAYGPIPPDEEQFKVGQDSDWIGHR